MKLSPEIAAAVATETLKPRRVPAATIRSWRHRGLLAGGRGWVDGEHLAHFLEHLKLGDTPMIASELAKRSDLVQHKRVLTMPAGSSCGYCHLGRQKVSNPVAQG